MNSDAKESGALDDMRVRLDPLMSIVREGPDACFIMASERELFRLKGRTVPVLLEHVMPLLDGHRTVRELRAALADRLHAKAVDQLIRLLLSNRVVHDTTRLQALGPEEIEEFRGLCNLMARCTDKPYVALERLRTARVAVVGCASLAVPVVQSLGECAIGIIDVVAEPDTLPLPVLPLSQLRRWNPGQLADAITGADLVLGLQDGDLSSIGVLTELNQLSLAHGLTWLHLRLTLDAEGWLGPLHVPGGACYQCLNLRLTSNLKTWRERAVAQHQVAQRHLEPKRLGFGPLGAQLAGAAALEVIKYLTWIQLTQLASRCYLFDFLNHEISLHTVLRHPNCPACHLDRERQLATWSEDQVQLERMLL